MKFTICLSLLAFTAHAWARLERKLDEADTDLEPENDPDLVKYDETRKRSAELDKDKMGDDDSLDERDDADLEKVWDFLKLRKQVKRGHVKRGTKRGFGKWIGKAGKFFKNNLGNIFKGGLGVLNAVPTGLMIADYVKANKNQGKQAVMPSMQQFPINPHFMNPYMFMPQMGQMGFPQMGQMGFPQMGQMGVPQMGQMGFPQMGRMGVPHMGQMGINQANVPGAAPNAGKPPNKVGKKPIGK